VRGEDLGVVPAWLDGLLTVLLSVVFKSVKLEEEEEEVICLFIIELKIWSNWSNQPKP